MMIFDMKCRVIHPIHAEDGSGRDVELRQGTYRLRGSEHLTHEGTRTYAGGMDLALVARDGGETAYPISPEMLAGFLAHGEVELTV